MTADKFKLTVLVEDTSDREDIVPEHGWSVLVEHGETHGLFDTGQTDILLGNALNLDVDLSRLSWIVLSHGHYDHTGGLKSVLKVAEKPVVHAHPDAFRQKYVKEKNGTWREAGMSISRQDIERAGATVTLSKDSAHIQARITAIHVYNILPQ